MWKKFSISIKKITNTLNVTNKSFINLLKKNKCNFALNDNIVQIYYWIYDWIYITEWIYYYMIIFLILSYIINELNPTNSWLTVILNCYQLPGDDDENIFWTASYIFLHLRIFMKDLVIYNLIYQYVFSVRLVLLTNSLQNN